MEKKNCKGSLGDNYSTSLSHDAKTQRNQSTNAYRTFELMPLTLNQNSLPSSSSSCISVHQFFPNRSLLPSCNSLPKCRSINPPTTATIKAFSYKPAKPLFLIKNNSGVPDHLEFNPDSNKTLTIPSHKERCYLNKYPVGEEVSFQKTKEPLENVRDNFFHAFTYDRREKEHASLFYPSQNPESLISATSSSEESSPRASGYSACNHSPKKKKVRNFTRSKENQSSGLSRGESLENIEKPPVNNTNSQSFSNLGKESSQSSSMESLSKLSSCSNSARSNSVSCLVEGCLSNRCIPFTHYCFQHIYKSTSQVLFEPCSAKFITNLQCNAPTFDSINYVPLCSLHARKKALHDSRALESAAAKLKKRTPNFSTLISRTSDAVSSHKPKKKKESKGARQRKQAQPTTSQQGHLASFTSFAENNGKSCDFEESKSLSDKFPSQFFMVGDQDFPKCDSMSSNTLNLSNDLSSYYAQKPNEMARAKEQKKIKSEEGTGMRSASANYFSPITKHNSMAAAIPLSIVMSSDHHSLNSTSQKEHVSKVLLKTCKLPVCFDESLQRQFVACGSIDNNNTHNNNSTDEAPVSDAVLRNSHEQYQKSLPMLNNLLWDTTAYSPYSSPHHNNSHHHHYRPPFIDQSI